jgi:hypothetical protein
LKHVVRISVSKASMPSSSSSVFPNISSQRICASKSRSFPLLRALKFQIRAILEVVNQLVHQHGNFGGSVALPVFWQIDCAFVVVVDGLNRLQITERSSVAIATPRMLDLIRQ